MLKHIHLDRVYSSTLTRARRTAHLALAEADAAGADVGSVKIGDGWKMTEDDALRERDYGDLVGLNKAETAEKYGD